MDLYGTASRVYMWKLKQLGLGPHYQVESVGKPGKLYIVPNFTNSEWDSK